jgi:hypothetical protein
MSSSSLDRVAKAARDKEQAHHQLLDALADATADGVPQAQLIAAAGISRPTLWRWVTAHLPDRGSTTPESASS